MIIILSIGVSLCLFSSCSAMYTGADYMGTFFILELKGNKSNRAKSEIIAELIRIENLMSINIESSDVYRINYSDVGEEITISDEVYALLVFTKELYVLTQGAYNPAILPVVEAYGLAPNMAHKIPSQEELAQSLELTDYNNLVMLNDNKVKKLSQLKLDLGSIAKGYAVEKCAEIAYRYNLSGIINLGGNIHCIGEGNIAIANPRDSIYPYNGYLKLNNQAIATSGDYERYFIEDNIRYHHIIGIDGMSAMVDNIISVTIFADNATYCDALSTAVYLTGFLGAEQFYIDYAISIIVLTEDKEVYVYGEDIHYILTDISYTIIE